jgi:hypothetical protein
MNLFLTRFNFGFLNHTETKQDLLKTRADLTKKDDDLSIKLKGI